MPKSFEEFKRTHSGRDIFSKYKADEKGLWVVYGEDPNCDFGGSHHEPILGYFSGTFENVVRYAVTLPKFWQWGAGGRVVKVTVVNIDAESLKRKAVLASEQKELQARLKEVQNELKTLGG